MMQGLDVHRRIRQTFRRMTHEELEEYRARPKQDRDAYLIGMVAKYADKPETEQTRNRGFEKWK